MSLHHSPTFDPRQILCWRSDLGITPTEDADGPCRHIEDPRNGKFFRIGDAEFTFLSQFDGHKTWQDVFHGTNRGLGNNGFSESEACSVTLWALQNGLLSNEASPSLSNVAASTPPHQATPWSLLSIRIPLGSPDRLCERVLPWVDWLFRTPVFVAWLLLVAAALYEVAVDWKRFVAATSQIFVPENWLTLGAAWLVLKVIHESAHALVCKRHGGEVRQVGIAFLFFAPVAFVDVTSCWRFRSHWHRIQTAAAGMYVEVAAAAFAVLVASRVESPEWNHFLDNVAVMASITTLLFNLNPLSRFDGYYILSDLCQIANLYARGRRAAKQLAARCFFGGSDSDEPTSWLLAGYGFATMLWSLSVLVGLIIAASWYWNGLGLILSVSLLLSWCLGWVRRARHSLRTFTSRPGGARRRFAFRTLLFSAACATALAIVPWPFVTTAPGIVEFSPLSVVRTGSSGFVQRVLVHDGESVVAEQPLLELRNENLERQRQDLELEIEQSRVRERIAAERHDVAKCQVEQQQRDALQSRLAERQQQVDRLTLRAPIAGVVISRQLAALEGSFVSEGRELLSIGDPTQREFVASIRQDDLLAASDTVERPVTVRLNGRGSVSGRIQRLNPKASITPEFLCLCAPLGGPLPVRSVPSDVTARDTSVKYELLQPHFRVTVTLDMQGESQPLAGELGWVSLGHRRTCGRELLSWLTHWISEHQRRT